MKILKYILIIAAVLFLGYLIWDRQEKTSIPKIMPEDAKVDLSVKNLSYEVEGENFALVNGEATNPVPDIPAVFNSLALFGEPVYGDLDADGDKDAAVWLLNDPGGTGKFYYAAFVINDSGIGKTAPAYFLGDRIAPQSLSISGGVATYSFADRKPDEPFTTEPTVGKSVKLRFDKKAEQVIE